jgi:diamine N-acetyltransferase
MSEITIAIARPADVPGIHAAAEASWRATYKDIFPDEFITRFLENAYSLENLELAVNSPRTVFLAARNGDDVIGFCHYGPSREHSDLYPIELYRIYVVPAFWRQGIGSRLLAEMEGRLTEQDVPSYYCHVHARNEIGKGFYLRHGFYHNSERNRTGDEEWCMVKSLKSAGQGAE